MVVVPVMARNGRTMGEVDFQEPDFAHSRLREALRYGSFTIPSHELPPASYLAASGSSDYNDESEPESPVNSRRMSVSSVDSSLGLTSAGEACLGRQERKLDDKLRWLKAEKASRLEGLANTRRLSDKRKLEILEEVRDWVHVRDPRTGDEWFLDKETERIQFDRPIALKRSQGEVDREVAVNILKKVKAGSRSDAELKDLCRVLKDNAFMMQLGEETVRAACQIMEYMYAPPNTPIMYQGQDADNFYLLLSGSVGVWSRNKDAPPRFEMDPDTNGPRDSICVVSLGEGKGFGEQGLMYEQKRNASIVSENHCVFAVIQKEHFDTVMKAHFLREASVKIDFLKSLPMLLERLSGDLSWTEAAGFFKETYFSRDDYLCTAGKFSEHLYILYEGSCEIRFSSNGAASEEPSPSLVQLKPGQVLGVSSLLLGKPEAYDVVCKSPALTVLRMEKADVFGRLPQSMTDIMEANEEIRLDSLTRQIRLVETSMAFNGLKGGLQEMRRNSRVSGFDLFDRRPSKGKCTAKELLNNYGYHYEKHVMDRDTPGPLTDLKQKMMKSPRRRSTGDIDIADLPNAGFTAPSTPVGPMVSRSPRDLRGRRRSTGSMPADNYAKTW